MNVLDGSATENAFVTADGITLPAPGIDLATVKYGIRPEDLHIDPDGVDVDVIVVEPTGPETHIVGKLGNQSISAVLKARTEILPGSKIKLMPETARMHLFSREGLNLRQ